MRAFREIAEGYRMAAVVEVHDEEELKPAIASGARIIGVHNRNLHTFQVDLGVSLRLAGKIPAGVLKGTESGIHSAADVERPRPGGYPVCLVGEHLKEYGAPPQA